MSAHDAAGEQHKNQPDTNENTKNALPRFITDLGIRHTIGLALVIVGAILAPFNFVLGLFFFVPAFFFLATRAWVAVVVILLAFYLFMTAQRGWLLVTSDGWVAKAIGVALLLLPIVGVWVLAREIVFGVRSEQMAKTLEREGGLPPDDLPRRPSGRVVREAADAAFDKYRKEAEAAPEDWRSWFRLACAYDVAGDRTRARRSMRDAQNLFLEARASAKNGDS